jgi:oligopeptide transport system ATP-binding protein
VSDEALLDVRDLVVRHSRRRGAEVRPAVAGVSLRIPAGQVFGLVGESGCGKSSLVRGVLQLHRPASGQVWFAGRELTGLSQRALRAVRREMQPVFQDTEGALSPRLSIADILAEPLRAHGQWNPTEGPARVRALLDAVGLSPREGCRFSHELSGGQRQRVGIARALALRPRLLLLDEPVSALDVSVQAGVLDLFQQLRTEHGLTYLFITHDLSVVRHMCDTVAVMHGGRIVESGPVATVFSTPRDPHTRELLAAVPRPDPAAERRRREQRAARMRAGGTAASRL